MLSGNAEKFITVLDEQNSTLDEPDFNTLNQLLLMQASTTKNQSSQAIIDEFPVMKQFT